jgi:transcriptional regulator with XRE-family HTH domain
MADLSRVGKEPDLAAVFRRAREVAGLKQEDVAAAVSGLTQSTYSRFELGQADLSVEQIFEIKAFLDGKESKRVGGGVSLASLAWAGPLPSSGPKTKGKLTEEIAKQLSDEFYSKQAAELDRQLDEELPALRETVTKQQKEIADLKAQLRQIVESGPPVRKKPGKRKR